MKVADTCPAELALVRSAYEALETETFGAPRPFSEDLPPAFKPDGFREAVEALVRECPELGLREPMVDCEEFPCQVFFLVEEGSGGFDSRGLNDCAAWDERMGGAGASTGTGQVVLDGETRRIVGFSPTPTDDARPADASKRTFHRFSLNRERMADHLGARPLSEREKAQSMVRMLESQLERADAPDVREALERQLERARAVSDGLP